MKILQPRRGRKSTANLQNFILRSGEVFFEVPDTGIGTGKGKLKVGDGITPYNKLPYFFEDRVYNIPIVSNGNDGFISKEDKAKLDTISNNANYYTHPYGSGNNHIPSGGSSGQILKWNGDGVATWGNRDVPVYSLSSTGNDGLMSKSDKAKLDGIGTYATKTTVVDNSNSSSATGRSIALSANQGRIINGNLDKFNNKADQLQNNFNNTLSNLYNEFMKRKIYPSGNKVSDLSKAISQNINNNKAFVFMACGLTYYWYGFVGYNDNIVDIGENRISVIFKRDVTIRIDSCSNYGYCNIYVNDIDQGNIFTLTAESSIHTFKRDFIVDYYTGTITIKAGSKVAFKSDPVAYFKGLVAYIA